MQLQVKLFNLCRRFYFFIKWCIFLKKEDRSQTKAYLVVIWCQCNNVLATGNACCIWLCLMYLPPYWNFQHMHYRTISNIFFQLVLFDLEIRRKTWPFCLAMGMICMSTHNYMCILLDSFTSLNPCKNDFFWSPHAQEHSIMLTWFLVHSLGASNIAAALIVSVKVICVL